VQSSSVEKKDRDLASQIRRAAASITLNLREGAERRGKDREHLWRIAAGSAAEVDEALHIALAWDYAPAELVTPAQALASRVIALLWRLAPPRR
jgi:four helix bundle protein